MKFVLPNVEFIEQQPGIDGIYQAIANAARICYASERKDKIQELIDRLISSKHFRPLEFGTVYLTINVNEISVWNFYTKNPYSRVLFDDKYVYITTNYRVLIENDLLDHLKYLTDFVPYKHAYRMTLHWTISRVTADSFRTHTSISTLMQSTRYCCYAKDKFNNQIQIVQPVWFNEKESFQEEYIRSIEQAEKAYISLCNEGMPAEFARGVLPLDIKTECIQCGFMTDWDSFFNQRYYGTTGKPHPDAKYISEKAIKIYNQKFKEIVKNV